MYYSLSFSFLFACNLQSLMFSLSLVLHYYFASLFYFCQKNENAMCHRNEIKKKAKLLTIFIKTKFSYRAYINNRKETDVKM